MIKVVIADNHPIVRLGIKSVLDSASDFEVIEDVSTTSELFEKLKKATPDVIILEMDIPEINGIATLRKIKEEYPEVKVLIYSGQSEDVYANIDEMSDRIMKLPGVKRIKILTYNKRPILKKGKPLVY